MTLHLLRRALATHQAACVGSDDLVVLVGGDGDIRPPAGVRCERLDGPAATIDDAALVALIFEADRVIAW